jgi:hypothetical protein
MKVDGDIVDGRRGHDIPMLDDARSLGSVDLVDVAFGFISSDRVDVYDEVLGIDNETGNRATEVATVNTAGITFL